MTTNFALGLAIFACILSIVSYVAAVRIARLVATELTESGLLAKIARLEASVTDLHDSYEALLDSHKKLRSRIGMRKVREARGKASADVPDAENDPEAWKAAMRQRLHFSKFGGK